MWKKKTLKKGSENVIKQTYQATINLTDRCSFQA